MLFFILLSSIHALLVIPLFLFCLHLLSLQAYGLLNVFYKSNSIGYLTFIGPI